MFDQLLTLLGYWFPWILFLGFFLGLLSRLWLFLAKEKTGESAPAKAHPGLLGAALQIHVVRSVVMFFASLVWIFGLIFLVRSYFVEPFRIPSASMEPTLIPGDAILVNKMSYGFPAPLLRSYWWLRDENFDRGDVIVFRYPCDPKVKFIKRVIGLPGDTVKFSADSLVINGERVAQSAATNDRLPQIREEILPNNQKNHPHQLQYSITPERVPQVPFVADCNREPLGIPSGELLVPEGKLLVMGDNRLNSKDGRFWGFVDMTSVEGRAWFRVLNLQEAFSLDFRRTGFIQ